MLLELKRGVREGVEEGMGQVLVKTNVRGGPYQSMVGGLLRLAPALIDSVIYYDNLADYTCQQSLT